MKRALAASTSSSVTVKKRVRFDFANHHDVALLRSCVQHNSWQMGEGQWNSIESEMKDHGWVLAKRSLKLHVNLLLEKLKKETLVVKSGTEEECNEPVDLLKEVEPIIEQSEVGLFQFTGGDDSDPEVHDVVFDPEKVEQVKVAVKPKSKNEKKTADLERDQAVKLMRNALELELEAKKEERLADDGKRNQDLFSLMQAKMQSQSQIQTTLLQLMMKQSDK